MEISVAATVRESDVNTFGERPTVVEHIRRCVKQPCMPAAVCCGKEDTAELLEVEESSTTHCKLRRPRTAQFDCCNSSPTCALSW